MRPLWVPPHLRERLGADGSDDLATLLQTTGAAWSDDVLTLATERFGRMLAEESGRLRVEIARVECSLRTEIAELRATIREELAATRADVLRWSFVFWMGQVMSMAGLLAYFLR